MRDESNFVSGWLVPTLMAVAMAMSVSLAFGANDAKQRVEVVQRWAGSVDDVEKMKLALDDRVIADAKTWESLREAWKLGDETKGVDFARQLVLVGTTRGSRIGGEPILGDKGDLSIAFVSTRDLRPGFRYLIFVVPREGITSVNGKPI
jgi:hypothetical protein